MPRPINPDEIAWLLDMLDCLIPHHGVNAAHLAVRLADKHLSNPATRERCLDRVAMLLGMEPGEVGGSASQEEWHAVPRRRRSA